MARFSPQPKSMHCKSGLTSHDSRSIQESMTAPSRPPILTHVADKVGGFAALARHLKIKRQAVCQWERIPADRVIEIEKLTKVSRHDLRPDLHPRESAA